MQGEGSIIMAVPEGSRVERRGVILLVLVCSAVFDKEDVFNNNLRTSCAKRVRAWD
jgi:hypothetical protein